MQSALAPTTDLNESPLVHATQLREMTITKEELAKRQKNSVLDSLMSSMVRIASEAGGSTFAANLNPAFDPALLAEIVTELEAVGYTVTTEEKTQDAIGSFILVTINW